MTGLLTWQEVFGPEYAAMFVFAYWIVEKGGDPMGQGLQVPSPHFGFAGRRYSFWLAPVADYARHQKRLSPRWDTVSVPRDAFRDISTRLEAGWPPAPC